MYLTQATSRARQSEYRWPDPERIAQAVQHHLALLLAAAADVAAVAPKPVARHRRPAKTPRKDTALREPVQH